MDKRFLCLGLLLLFCLFSGGSFAIDNVTYKHPTLNIQFEAEENWRRIRRPEDNNSYEIVDPSGSIHVILWATTTEQDAVRYLEKMASMKDVLVGEGEIPERKMINGWEAFVMRLRGVDQKKPIRTILATIPHGMSAEYPKEFSLFLLQIWCPEEDYESCRMSMESILNSVLILQ